MSGSFPRYQQNVKTMTQGILKCPKIVLSGPKMSENKEKWGPRARMGPGARAPNHFSALSDILGPLRICFWHFRMPWDILLTFCWHLGNGPDIFQTFFYTLGFDMLVTFYVTHGRHRDWHILGDTWTPQGMPHLRTHMDARAGPAI